MSFQPEEHEKENMMSRNAAERLFLQHSRERDAAHAEAKRVANRIVAGLHEVRTANTFAGLDLAELLHDLQSSSTSCSSSTWPRIGRCANRRTRHWGEDHRLQTGATPAFAGLILADSS